MVSYPVTIDDFEDGDLSEYTLTNTGSASYNVTTDDSFSGSYSVEMTSNDESKPATISTTDGDGLPRYFSQSEIITGRFKLTPDTVDAFTGVDSFFNKVVLELRPTNDDRKSFSPVIAEVSDGEIQVDGESIETDGVYDDWIRIDVRQRIDNTFTVEVTANAETVSVDGSIDDDDFSGKNGYAASISYEEEAGITSASAYYDFTEATGDTAIKDIQAEKASMTATPLLPTSVPAASTTATKPLINTTALQAISEFSIIADAAKPQIQTTGLQAVVEPKATIPGSKPLITASPLEASGYTNQLQIDGTQVGRLQEEKVKFNRYIPTFKVDETTLKDTIRQLDFNDGKYEYLPLSDGSFKTVDTVGGDNTYILTPSISRDEVRDARKYVVDSYSEREVGFQGDSYLVTIAFVPLSPREMTNTLSETAGSGEWEFQFEAGTIATQRVKAGVSTTSSGDPGSIELDLVLGLSQTRAVEESLSYLEGVRTESIPEGDSRIKDTTANARNTILITPPQTGTVDAGTYIVEDWETNWRSDAYYDVKLRVSGVTLPLVSSSKTDVNVNPKTATKQ